MKKRSYRLENTDMISTPIYLPYFIKSSPDPLVLLHHLQSETNIRRQNSLLMTTWTSFLKSYLVGWADLDPGLPDSDSESLHGNYRNDYLE